MLTVTKSYRDLPAAHRQPNHDGHCRKVHGHNWGFDIILGAHHLDANGFVWDVGKLKPLKARLTELFDHTCLINADDPLLDDFKRMDSAGLVDLVVVDNCGMEGLAKVVFNETNRILTQDRDACARNVECLEVVCWEDSKNKANYKP